MPRWEPNVRERLEAAALDLFEEHGYDAVTVAQVAQAAGVTSRTYFRQFPDKREVLFGGADAMRATIVDALRGVPSDVAEFTSVLWAVESADSLFAAYDRDRLRRRDALIAESAELREREAMKLATIAADVAEVLVERGVTEQEAVLVADLGVVLLTAVSRAWSAGASDSFGELVTQTAERLKSTIDVAL